MTTSELITPQHLTRKAIIYIRQSSPHQVLTNQESLRLQYALRERAVELGWRTEEIEIIDGDLGLSGAATHDREGFKELLTRVTLGEVGLIFSVEVQRLSRNCSDWYPLLDLCGYKHCLIADRDGVYDHGKRASSAGKSEELHQIGDAPAGPLAFDFQGAFPRIAPQQREGQPVHECHVLRGRALIDAPGIFAKYH